MSFKKLFFPIGGGDELEERITGALLVAKYFNAHLEVLTSRLDSNAMFPKEMAVSGNLVEEMGLEMASNFNKELKKCESFFNEKCESLGIEISQTPLTKTSAVLVSGVGYRSELVAQKSKFCDLVIAATPPNGIATSTFEAAVTQSGKPVLVIPRVMESLKMENIIIGWNNSPEISRSISLAMPILKKANKVHIISTKEYAKDDLKNIKNLVEYLAIHQIKADYEIIKTTRIPGEALLKYSHNNLFDLIIAGAFGHQGLKEKMLGGSTKYLLKHTEIPMFMSH